MLTYKHHIDKKALEAFIKARAPVSFLRIAHESGDAHHPYLHTHVLIQFEGLFRSNNCRVFDIRDAREPNGRIHPHISRIQDTRHWCNAKRYLAKEDPENSDLGQQDFRMEEKRKTKAFFSELEL